MLMRVNSQRLNMHRGRDGKGFTQRFFLILQIGNMLEVKYNGFLLSYIKHMLLPVQKSELSVSKYCMARQIGCNYRF